MNLELKDFMAGTLAMENQEHILEQLLLTNERILNKEIVSERMYYDLELVTEMIENLLPIEGNNLDNLRELIAKYCLYSYYSGLVFGTTTSFKEAVEKKQS